VRLISLRACLSIRRAVRERKIRVKPSAQNHGANVARHRDAPSTSEGDRSHGSQKSVVNRRRRRRRARRLCERRGRAGRDEQLAHALAIGAGHSFIVFLREGFPVNVLGQVKLVPEVCRIYCATANPVQVIVAETAAGRGILGVIDGGSPIGVETEADVAERMQLLRQIGYKL